MRIDKFLKVSRIIKRRTVAKELCDAGRVRVNGNVAKAGTVLSEGDILEISFGTGLSKVRVLKLAQTVRKDEARTLYELI